ncbi:MAG: hypothetical protein K2H91_06515 [Lachnospiraceae bacterium]|nr:hypothetical protein [Lachnospiraceae bacterium]
MEDENQRRAWEYLHGLNRRDGSYRKVLSDALVAVIDGKNNTQITMLGDYGDKMHGGSDEGLMAFSNKFAEIVLDGIKELLAEKIVFKSAEKIVHATELPKQELESDIAEDMLDFAFAMGE